MPKFNANNVIIETAEHMCAAAITAPKTKGVNLLSVFYLMPEEFEPLFQALETLSLKYDKLRPLKPYRRDFESLKNTQCLVVLTSKRKLMDIAGCDACGFSGEPNGCKAAAKVGASCAYNAKDLGIATCSATLIAHQRLVDNRIIDTVGRAIVNLNLYQNYINSEIFDAVCIALSISAKNPFFDRMEQKNYPVK